MKKNNKAQRPCDAQIRQMRKNKVILLTGIIIHKFVEACDQRGIELGMGSTYEGGQIFYEK